MGRIPSMLSGMAAGQCQGTVGHAGHRSDHGGWALKIVVLISVFLVPSLPWAEVYTWTDKDGNVHFSDTPPASGKAKTIRPPVRPASHCTLMMDEFEAWEKDSRPWRRKALEGYMSRDSEGLKDSTKKLDTEQGRAMAAKINAEENKCRGGDADACKCMQSIEAKFSKMSSDSWGNLSEGR